MSEQREKKSRFEPTRRALIFWTLFVGIGAVGGAASMLADPSGKFMGMDALLPYFQKLPLADVLFCDLKFSGFALLIVNGLSNLTAAVLLLRRKKAGIVLGGIFGVTLMLWICIQFYFLPLNFMSTAFFIIGLIQAITGYMAWVFYKQERFSVSLSDYPNIGTNPKRLVVFFSRMGYTKKLAFEAAERSGASLYEIRATEKTEGTLGFWWCGRYGMHRWTMPIEEPDVEPSAFEHVTICCPIWVFGAAAPVRSFCIKVSGRVKEADYILVHHQKSPYWTAADELDRLLGLENSPAVSVCCRKGDYIGIQTRNQGAK